MSNFAGDGLLPAGAEVDLDNCEREPIHIPGSIQPRGVLLVVREPELVVTQVSANVTEVLGIAVEDALNAPLHTVIGERSAAVIAKATASFGDLRERNPLEVTVDGAGGATGCDAILYRESGGILLIELEAALGPRPFSFPNTYLSVRGAVGRLNRSAGLGDLFDTTARAIRELTGFDRVMVYRYDHEYNGEVVAEAKRADLNSFLGLHYPASDIPAQARALYEKNWIRLISDVSYLPSPLVPAINPMTGAPLDLTHSTLRSVSPIHIEYLKNMGVHASMSVSLLRDGSLWGLIACHHYAGPHLPPFGTRSAAEFLGSTLSLRLVDRFGDDELRTRLASQAVLAKLTAATLDEGESIVDALLGEPDLLDLIAADGVAIAAQGRYGSRGTLPGEAAVREVARWALTTGDDVVQTDCLSRALPDLDVAPELSSGALALVLPEGQFVIWFRAEVELSVDWGGDPHNKAMAVREANGDGVRMSPRKSFERWREIVRQRSLAWQPSDSELAAELRGHVVEALYQRSRGEVRLAETLQRSLLPVIPELLEWSLSAHYEPAAGGRIGGDWYDAFALRNGELAVALGDVAGHGIGAAGIMAQLRNALRAYLFDDVSPVVALERMNDFTTHLLPRAFATLVVGRIDLTTGHVQAASAGHPTPFLIDGHRDPVPAPIVTSPPLGVRGAAYRSSQLTLRPGAGLVFFSDGVVERRDEEIDAGVDRLRDALRLLGGRTYRGDFSAAAIWESVRRADVDDDVTVMAVRRPYGRRAGTRTEAGTGNGHAVT